MVSYWIAGLQIPSSLISTIGSSTMAVMILRSQEPLKNPFKRLILGLSLSDVLNSGALMLAPFLTPKTGDSDGGINVGTQTTCDFQVVIFVVGGFLGVIGYTFGLCLYYLFVIRYNYSDQQFAVRVERLLHAAIFIMSIVVTTSVLVTKSANAFPDGTMCYVIDHPFGCDSDPDVECIRGHDAKLIGYYLIILPVACVFFGMIVVLGTLCRTVLWREKSSRSRLRSSFVGSLQMNASNNCTNNSISNRRSSFITRGERQARKRSRETLYQAVLYISAYTITYIGPTVALLGFYYRGKSPPEVFSIIVHCIYPMGGVLNILVYTRPKVATVRKRKAEYTWCKAFWEVVKAGGEVPSDCVSRSRFNRRGSLRQRRGSANNISQRTSDLHTSDQSAGYRRRNSEATAATYSFGRSTSTNRDSLPISLDDSFLNLPNCSRNQKRDRQRPKLKPKNPFGIEDPSDDEESDREETAGSHTNASDSPREVQFLGKIESPHNDQVDIDEKTNACNDTCQNQRRCPQNLSVWKEVFETIDDPSDDEEANIACRKSGNIHLPGSAKESQIREKSLQNICLTAQDTKYSTILDSAATMNNPTHTESEPDDEKGDLGERRNIRFRRGASFGEKPQIGRSSQLNNEDADIKRSSKSCDNRVTKDLACVKNIESHGDSTATHGNGAMIGCPSQPQDQSNNEQK